ncbi:MAG: Fpg/Nei family DNA glycosylase [Planctomycetota bacterium]|jgi:formamidopyrimidine-DNA glycosylase
MPELPEVEAARRMARKRLKGARIVAVYAVRDPIVFEGVTGRRFAAALKGRKILAVNRKGKHIWMELDSRPWPAFHFGMTGEFDFYNSASARPKFCKLELHVAAGGRFAFCNTRRLGRVRLLDDPERRPPISELGFDALLDELDAKEIGRILAKRAAAIKAVLLDQSVFAGVGNWIADEVLYQARISPHRPARKLSPEEVARVCRTLVRIVSRAVQVDADYTRFPGSWLFHYRWDKNSQPVAIAGRRIRFDAVAGRTTAWVPKRQR